MPRRIMDALSVLAAVVVLSTTALLPGWAAAGSGPAAAVIQGQTPATSPVAATAAGVTSTPAGSPSPTGPADPGTGETRESKQARVDYAPYVIGAVLLVTVAGAAVLRRRRKDKTIV